MDVLVEVALKVAHNNGIFTYRVPQAHNRGDLFGKRVQVTLKNRPALGVIVDLAKESALKDLTKIKDIIDIIDDEAILTKEQFALMKFCSHYYFNPLGMCVHLAIPRDQKPAKSVHESPITKLETNVLSSEQKKMADDIAHHSPRAFLIEGVTGSGKTHIYLKIAQDTLTAEKSVLFIVPEISLTQELVRRVTSFLGAKTVVIHSNITPQKKRDALFSLIKKQARVIIGARSALFAPLPNLGLIVVDEEHDESYKQDESPRYHARDLALWRAKNENACIILGSATPSLESMANADKGKLKYLKLSHRFNEKRSLPEVSIIDLKERSQDVDFRMQDLSKSSGQKMCILSRPLVTEITQTLKAGAQALLFLNQRGYAKFGICHQCGQMVHCPNCSVSLTYYHHRRALTCHLCQYSESSQNICRHCLKDGIKFLGLGTERLEEEVKNLFPHARIRRLDRDVVKSERRLKETLSAMHEQEADILIGTQMLAKGHNFLHVNLVGVICADVALSMPDFRASEKTFQLLTQVAGRAGRGYFSGKALIQTFQPEHPSIIFAKNHNTKDFISQELILRKRFSKPPFSRLALIRAEHIDEEISQETMEKAANCLAKNPSISLLGPSPSPIERINKRFRFQCMITAKSHSILHDSISQMVQDSSLKTYLNHKRPRLIIDVDPQNLS